jgi:paraquat-inducible protein B
MSQRANATLIGAFVLGGIALVVAGILAATGGKLFSRKERAVMFFSGSIYGLEVGAPVVFRGVRLGSVSSIRVVYDAQKDSFSIPVVAELERDGIGGGHRPNGEENPDLTLQNLVAKGLRAQLSMQSLLTGQLYVNLDLEPGKPPPLNPLYGGAVEIPTSATAIQNLKNQLDGINFRGLFEDISAIAAAAKSLATGPQVKQSLDNLARISENVRILTARLDQRIGPLTDAAQGTLGESKAAMSKLGNAADRVGNAAGQLGDTSQRIGTLVAPDSLLVMRLQNAADELARTAASLRQATDPNAPLLQDSDRALQELSGAARSLKDLADLLRAHPEALLRGNPAGSAP